MTRGDGSCDTGGRKGWEVLGFLPVWGSPLFKILLEQHTARKA